MEEPDGEESGHGKVAICSLLADLASHHERLTQASQDLGSSLALAQEAAGQVRTLLLGANLNPEQQSAAQAVAACQPTGESPCALQDELPPLVPSEWHNSLPQSLRGIRAAAADGHDPEAIESPQVQEVVWQSLRKSVSKLCDGLQEADGDCRGEGEGVPGMGGVNVMVDRSSNPFLSVTTEDIDALPAPRLSTGSDFLPEKCWNQQMNFIRRQAVERLVTRLGVTMSGDVTSVQVYSALVKVKVFKFSPEDIDRLLLKIESVWAKFHNGNWSSLVMHAVSWRSSPSLRRQAPRTAVGDDFARQVSGSTVAIQVRILVEVLLDDSLLGRLPRDLQKMSQTVREVLFSGDANVLVAEITQVSVEEVAGPMERPDLVTRLEPFVGLLIFANGIFIGLQSSALDRHAGDNWFWGNAAFTTMMLLEAAVRFWTLGFREFFISSLDRWWNLFDLIMIVVATADVIVEALEMDTAIAPLSIMRIMRLTRLTRLVRIFRLRFLKELNLMVRGLLGGLRTLFWAIVLLFFTLYVIAVFATTTIGNDDSLGLSVEVAREELFSSVPRAVFTAFRCFMGDCNTSGGKPIIKLMSDAYGPTFSLFYIASTVFVVFGLFNLIVAVYVENTMSAAKTEGEKTPAERERDAIRIAKQTRQLLKKFCTVQKLWNQRSDGDDGIKEMLRAMRASAIDDLGEVEAEVSKDMYQCIIQDPVVQKLMDDMDVPPDRSHLFEVLDADCSGGLEVSELITGLLRVRGEARKSDVVGTLLAVRTIQEMIRALSCHLETTDQSPNAPKVRHSMDDRPESSEDGISSELMESFALDRAHILKRSGMVDLDQSARMTRTRPPPARSVRGSSFGSMRLTLRSSSAI